MRTAAVAAIVGLLTLGTVAVPGFDTRPAAAQSGIYLTEGHIAQAKAALHLTPAQERHWPAVASAMRSLIKAQANEEQQSDGMVSRIRSRAASLSATTTGIRRLIAAARPLIRSLDAQQRQDAQAMARSMGFTKLASVL